MIVLLDTLVNKALDCCSDDSTVIDPLLRLLQFRLKQK